MQTKESARALDRDELDYFIVWDGGRCQTPFYGHLQKQEEKGAEIKLLRYIIKRIVPGINEVSALPLYL